MLENYSKEVILLVKWYERAKKVAIIAESMDTTNGGYIQPLHEQRYCLDHFIRAIVYEMNDEATEKIQKAFSSAIGHLQRSYSDSIEWILVSIKEEYCSVLEPFSSEQISKGFPAYYSDIRPEIDRITKLVSDYKIAKSIETVSDIDTTSSEFAIQFFDENVEEKLQQYLEILHNRQGVLLDISKRDNKLKKLKAFKDKFVFPIITGVIGAIISALVISFL